MEEEQKFLRRIYLSLYQPDLAWENFFERYSRFHHFDPKWVFVHFVIIENGYRHDFESCFPVDFYEWLQKKKPLLHLGNGDGYEAKFAWDKAVRHEDRSLKTLNKKGRQIKCFQPLYSHFKQ
jgi:hypothetical protein